MKKYNTKNKGNNLQRTLGQRCAVDGSFTLSNGVIYFFLIGLLPHSTLVPYPFPIYSLRTFVFIYLHVSTLLIVPLYPTPYPIYSLRTFVYIYPQADLPFDQQNLIDDLDLGQRKKFRSFDQKKIQALIILYPKFHRVFHES